MKKYNKTSQVGNLNSDWIKWIPLLFLIGLTPLLVKVVPVELPTINDNWYKGFTGYYDIFIAIKSKFIVLCGIICFVGLLAEIYRDKNKMKTLPFIMGFVCLLILFLTTIFAYDQNISLFGGFERFENVWVVSSYIVSALYASVLFNKFSNASFLIDPVLFAGYVITGLGALQLIGIQYLNLPIVSDFIFGGIDKNALKLNFEASRVFSTLYNPNYVDQYLSLLIPFSAVQVMMNQNKRYKALFGGLIVLSILCLIGTKGEGGVVGILFGLLTIGFILLLKKYASSEQVQVRMSLLGIGTLFLSMFMLFSMLAMGVFSNLKTDPKSDINTITVQENQIEFDFKNNLLVFENLGKGEYLKVRDDKGQKVEFVQSATGLYNISDPRFSEFAFGYINYANNRTILQIQKKDALFNFEYTAAGYQFLNSHFNGEVIKKAEKIGFEGIESIGSNRGYIWGRTLKLIADRPLLGYGIENYELVFPQTDYVEKYRFYNTPYMRIGKPHNLYLQLLTSMGIVGLCSFLTLYLLSLSGLVKNIFNKMSEENLRVVSLSILAALTGYFVSGMFYDSNVTTGPIFWIFVGCGLSSYMSQQKRA